MNLQTPSVADIIQETFYYLPQRCAVVCKPCGYAVPVDFLHRHLTQPTGHGFRSSFANGVARAVKSTYSDAIRNRDDYQSRADLASSDKSVLPHLPVYFDGFQCSQCEYICRSISGIHEHCRDSHAWINPRGHGGRPMKSKRFDMPYKKDVVCQRLFKHPGMQSYFHAIPSSCLNAISRKECSNTETPTTVLSSSNPSDTTMLDLIRTQLTQKTAEREQETQHRIEPGLPDIHKATLEAEGDFAWLRVTKWPTYFGNRSLSEAAELIDMPMRRTGPGECNTVLESILTSFDRVIEGVRDAVDRGDVNIFDQHKVNSFVPKRSFCRPILMKLQDQTYKTYKTVWKKLLCFTYRLLALQRGSSLHYVATDLQLSALDKLIKANTEYLQIIETSPDSETEYACTPDELQVALDSACLDFCISLLDQSLKGNVYDSILVAFTAVLGIDRDRDGKVTEHRFREPMVYTSHLSALVKMAQILVLARAELGARNGEAEFPASQ